MLEISHEKFEQVRKKAEELYRSIGEIWCPYFKEKVVFNTKGLEHLKFHNVRKARSRYDQYIRLRLIELAPKIINDSHTLQGVSVRNSFEREKTHSRWESVMRSATYHEFVAVIKEVRVRIIIKSVENGPKYFWSIIPFWKMDKISGKRLMHEGKPETD